MFAAGTDALVETCRLHLCYLRFWEGKTQLHAWSSTLAAVIAEAITLDAGSLPMSAACPTPPPPTTHAPFTPLTSDLVPSTAAACPAANPDHASGATTPRASMLRAPPSHQHHGGAPLSHSTAHSSLSQSLRRQLHEQEGSTRLLPASSLYWGSRQHTVHEERASAVAEAYEQRAYSSSSSLDPSLVHKYHPPDHTTGGPDGSAQSHDGARMGDRRAASWVRGPGGSASMSWRPPSAGSRPTLHQPSVTYFPVAHVAEQTLASAAASGGPSIWGPPDAQAVRGTASGAPEEGVICNGAGRGVARGRSSCEAARQHGYFADTLLHLGSLLHAVGLAALCGGCNLIHVTVRTHSRVLQIHSMDVQHLLTASHLVCTSYCYILKTT